MNITLRFVSHITGTNLPVNCYTERKSGTYQNYGKNLKYAKEKTCNAIM